ncbi:hypothetical protein D4764_0288900 [Takifugu flavidus]|uniref:Uncharacterized protein n=1 Tax=Takifugu flavidus TaxID=433684 RepID=A0A5C6MH33_9TELE|nr:hypothetical protein D4764_0288900 [Takifugu flavidus]
MEPEVENFHFRFFVLYTSRVCGWIASYPAQAPLFRTIWSTFELKYWETTGVRLTDVRFWLRNQTGSTF